MTLYLQQLINGLSLGSIYALIALGYTMVYGVLRFINFAHGDVFMLGAFAGFFLSPLIGKMLAEGSIANGAIVIILSMAICAVIGILIEILAYRPLRNRPKITVLITAIGVSLFIEYFCQNKRVIGPDPKSFPTLFPNHTFEFGNLILTSNDLVIVGLTLFLLFALRIVVLHTKLGTAMRALSFNPQAAALMGINTNVIISFTFGLGSALAAAGGILWSLNYPSIDPLMGIQPGLKAFVAAVLGGIGSIPGAALGGLVIGVLEAFVGGMEGWSTYRDGVAFAILILILLFKPSGILGKTQTEKV